MTDSLKKPTQLTKDGLEELQRELKELIEVRLPEVIARVEVARSFGDLSENAEYSSAKEEQELCQTRIEELNGILANVVVVKQTKQHNQVGMGSQVSLSTKNKKKMMVTIVGEFEADPSSSKISSASPLGKALLNKKKDEKFSVETPSGLIEYLVVEIK